MAFKSLLRFFFVCCRFDARDKSLLTYASHFSPIYGQRASMRLPNGLTSQNVAVLVLSHLRPEDEGVYKCRADFKRSPTRNNRMFLSILSKFQLGHLCTLAPVPLHSVPLDWYTVTVNLKLLKFSRHSVALLFYATLHSVPLLPRLPESVTVPGPRCANLNPTPFSINDAKHRIGGFYSKGDDTFMHSIWTWTHLHN